MNPPTLTINPLVDNMYPRLHLFGLAQELRDLIYDNVFAIGGEQGSDFLQPLTNRQFYHEANASAWNNATFVLTALDTDGVEVKDEEKDREDKRESFRLGSLPNSPCARSIG
jgi:hypothetical protein